MVQINNWFSIDTSNNITTITFGNTPTNTEFDFYLEYYKSLYREPITRSVVFDARKITNLPPSLVLKKMALMMTMKPIHKKYLTKFYVVATSKYTLNIIKSAFNVIKPVAPYEICNVPPLT